MPNRAFPSPETIAAWPEFIAENPLRLLVSGCLAGHPVGYDGSTYGRLPHIAKLIAMANVRATSFCPENFVFGTPRLLFDVDFGAVPKDHHEIDWYRTYFGKQTQRNDAGNR
jgi:hypothetical protein